MKRYVQYLQNVEMSEYCPVEKFFGIDNCVKLF